LLGDVARQPSTHLLNTSALQHGMTRLVIFVTLWILAWILLIRSSKRVQAALFFSVCPIFFTVETPIPFLEHRDWKNADFQRSPAPYYEFAGRPGATFDATLDGPPNQIGKVGHFALDSWGFRNRETPSSTKRRGERRIFIVGGSTVFNGFPEEYSIAGALQVLFDRRGPSNVKVYNYGIVSSISRQHLMLLLDKLIDLKPDLVIAYGGGNDVMEP